MNKIYLTEQTNKITQISYLNLVTLGSSAMIFLKRKLTPFLTGDSIEPDKIATKSHFTKKKPGDRLCEVRRLWWGFAQLLRLVVIVHKVAHLVHSTP